MTNLFYFTAKWCSPCTKVRPIVENLINDGYPFTIVDIDTEIELVKSFEIKSVPTFILLEDKVEIKRITGAQTKEQLLEFVNYEKNTKEDI